ncbi:MAG: hypothetical protein JXR37_35620, partial [Kiritimatiellae bacterium]|nr:hypothetical protein [Kiritimatiellia bacterium]
MRTISYAMILVVSLGRLPEGRAGQTNVYADRSRDVLNMADFSNPAIMQVGDYSSLVRPGRDGRLSYAPDKLGNRIPDFSHAG